MKRDIIIVTYGDKFFANVYTKNANIQPALVLISKEAFSYMEKFHNRDEAIGLITDQQIEYEKAAGDEDTQDIDVINNLIQQAFDDLGRSCVILAVDADVAEDFLKVFDPEIFGATLYKEFIIFKKRKAKSGEIFVLTSNEGSASNGSEFYYDLVPMKDYINEDPTGEQNNPSQN
ncbi:MAG: hypothetical protein WC795_00260 [Candidatus Paceibacterota bacterium]|jgi:hypothetical protein